MIVTSTSDVQCAMVSLRDLTPAPSESTFDSFEFRNRLQSK
jgi:hypothetical protein